MDKINETLLGEYLTNNLVKQIELRQTEQSRWQIWVQLNWKEELCNLITMRGSTREWANLDRLIKHFQDNHTGPFPPICLTLNQQKPDRRPE